MGKSIVDLVKQGLSDQGILHVSDLPIYLRCEPVYGYHPYFCRNIANSFKIFFPAIFWKYVCAGSGVG